mgnify:CR=1 FL=1
MDLFYLVHRVQTSTGTSTTTRVSLMIFMIITDFPGQQTGDISSVVRLMTQFAR